MEAIQFEEEWYKPICVRCPYFVDMKAGLIGMSMAYSTDIDRDVPKEPEPIVKCERPNGSGCLGENPLIQRAEVVAHIQRMVQLKRKAAVVAAKVKAQKAAERGSRNAQLDKPYKRGKVVRRKIKRSN